MVHFFTCLICGVNLKNQEVITNEKVCEKIIDFNSSVKGYDYPESAPVCIEDIYVKGNFQENYDYLLKNSEKFEKENKRAEEFYDKGLNSLKLIEKFNWLNQVIGILHNKNINVYLEDTGDYYEIYDEYGNDYSQLFYNSSEIENTIYIMHLNCYKLLRNNNYDISYNSLSDYNFNLNKGIEYIYDKKGKNKKDSITKKPLIRKNINNNKFNIDYGIIDKYRSSYSTFASYICYSLDRYLLEDPLKNKENSNRILQLNLPFRKILAIPKKKSLKKNRPSPSESATLFEAGYQQLGNDGGMYIIVEDKNGTKRWKKYVEK